MNRNSQGYYILLIYSLVTVQILSTSYNKLLLREPARFHGNDTSRRRVDSLSVLKKASDDAETSAFKF